MGAPTSSRSWPRPRQYSLGPATFRVTIDVFEADLRRAESPVGSRGLVEDERVLPICDGEDAGKEGAPWDWWFSLLVSFGLCDSL